MKMKQTNFHWASHCLQIVMFSKELNWKSKTNSNGLIQPPLFCPTGLNNVVQKESMEPSIMSPLHSREQQLQEQSKIFSAKAISNVFNFFFLFFPFFIVRNSQSLQMNWLKRRVFISSTLTIQQALFSQLLKVLQLIWKTRDSMESNGNNSKTKLYGFSVMLHRQQSSQLEFMEQFLLQ